MSLFPSLSKYLFTTLWVAGGIAGSVAGSAVVNNIQENTSHKSTNLDTDSKRKIESGSADSSSYSTPESRPKVSTRQYSSETQETSQLNQESTQLSESEKHVDRDQVEKIGGQDGEKNAGQVVTLGKPENVNMQETSPKPEVQDEKSKDQITHAESDTSSNISSLTVPSSEEEPSYYFEDEYIWNADECKRIEKGDIVTFECPWVLSTPETVVNFNFSLSSVPALQNKNLSDLKEVSSGRPNMEDEVVFGLIFWQDQNTEIQVPLSWSKNK
ncbi:hypothetical protein OVS_03280 [Mycoplasma ovis str. Michigan]|uniref:Uncharacterized protein n=1 Tax=Mycoplasma ovis str. Michigan TaxID=1415773 RepID=A0ABN4BPZ5_9MOLU|nr:hypothetical protein [Mycoplasma ovis]AHC40409.1 hypothetical protein OVS_03280 [Mycoplasma ovis str. Michigan]